MQRAFDTMSQSYNRGFDINALLKTNDITPAIQNHLSQVYLTLSAGIAAAAMGSYFHLLTNIGGILTFIATIGLMLWLAMEPDKTVTPKRLAIFAGFCFFKGASLGGLIEAILFVDPSILVTALVGTVAIFTCFSGAALIAKRRSYLYLGGLLGSAMSIMLLMRLVNMFFWSNAMMTAQLYMGLLVFSGYVIYDTQMIVEKANLGSNDVVWHATELFVDFVAIFVRIAIILMRNANNKKKSNRR